MNEAVVRLWQPEEWNRLLLDAVFERRGRTDTHVSYIDAYPRRLAELLGWASPDAVETAMRLFVEAHKPLVNRAGGSLVRSCLLMAEKKYWKPDSEHRPPFFGLLWLTCSIAWGYPDEAEGNFAARFRKLFHLQAGGIQPVSGEGDRRISTKLMPDVPAKIRVGDLWSLVADWVSASDAHLDFIVPGPAGHEAHVGISYALSQPDLRDRRWLARAVEDLDLAGYDPPPGPALRMLVAQAKESHPTVEFRDELVRLDREHRDGSKLQDDPIWAAVRRECLDPVSTSATTLSLAVLTAQLTEDLDGDSGHLVWVGLSNPVDPPDDRQRWVPDPFYPDRLILEQAEGADTDTLWTFLEEPWKRPPTGLRRLIRQGLLCFGRGESSDLIVVTGSELEGTGIALVRAPVLEAFTRSFGGRSTATSAKEWSVVRGCAVRSFEEGEVPNDLIGVDQLIRTSVPPTVRWVGGVRVGKREFFPNPRLLPEVLASRATEVTDHEGRSLVSVGEVGRWRFQPMDPLPSELMVRVKWNGDDAWPDRELRAAFRKETVKPPKRYTSSDHNVVGEENEARFDEVSGLNTADKQVLVLTDHPTCRHYGEGVGQVDVARRDSVATHYGRRGRPAASLLEPTLRLEPPSVVTKAQSRKIWREDMRYLDRARVFARGDGRTLAPADPMVRELCRRVHLRTQELPSIEDVGAGDGSLVSQLARAYGQPEIRQRAEELMAALAIMGGRKKLSRSDFLELVRDLSSAVDRMTDGKSFDLLAAMAESGRVDLARHRARPAVDLVGVRPHLRLAVIGLKPVRAAPVFDATLVGLVEHSMAEAIAENLAKIADIRWLRASSLTGLTGEHNRWVCPVLTFMTDSPARAQEFVGSILGDRLTEPAGGCTIGPVAPFELRRSPEVRPGGYGVTNSYDLSTGSPRHVHGVIPNSDGVVIERLTALHRNDEYLVRRGTDLLYRSRSREWAAVRAAEIAGVPAFSRCQHGLVWSNWRLFPRLPLPIARTLLNHGLGLSVSRFDEDGQRSVVEYPFGRGASVLDNLPNNWVSSVKECSCLIH